LSLNHSIKLIINCQTATAFFERGVTLRFFRAVKSRRDNYRGILLITLTQLEPKRNYNVLRKYTTNRLVFLQSFKEINAKKKKESRFRDVTIYRYLFNYDSNKMKREVETYVASTNCTSVKSCWW